VTGFTFDTGALIALERRRASVTKVYAYALRSGVPITVPTVVLAEWWRAGAGRRFRQRLLATVTVEDLTRRIAAVAGEAIGHVARHQPDAGTIDAIVVSSAWLRGDVVYTSDSGDLCAIRDAVPALSPLTIVRV
jgi:predicted nucleic acid-binding protein